MVPYGTDFGVATPRINFGQPDANYRGYGQPQDVNIVGVFNTTGAGTTNVIVISEDNGLTWTQIATPGGVQPFRYIAFSPTLGRLVCVGTGTRNVITSDDGGLTWTLRANAIPDSTAPAGRNLWRRVEWISQLGRFVTGEGSPTAGVYSQWLAHSADGITWTRVDTGSANIRGCVGVKWSDTIGALGCATNSDSQTGRLGFTTDLVAFSFIAQAGAGFDNPGVMEGSFGVNPRPFIAADGSFVIGCIQTSSFAPAQFMRSVDGVLLSYGVNDLAMGNNADSLGGEVDPVSGECFIHSSVNNSSNYTFSVTNGNTWGTLNNGLGARDQVMYKYLPGIERHVLTMADGTAATKVFESIDGRPPWTIMGVLPANRTVLDMTEVPR